MATRTAPISIDVVKWPRFVIYQDDSNEYRWRLVSRNRRIIADSGEGYSTKSGVWRAIDRLHVMMVPRFMIEDRTDG